MQITKEEEGIFKALKTKYIPSSLYFAVVGCWLLCSLEEITFLLILLNFENAIPLFILFK